MRHSLIASIIVAGALGCATTAIEAQSYPSRPIRIIVGSAPGGGTDLIARVVGQKLGESVGQQVIVENRGGAGSTIGYDAGVRAAPDGYTFILITPSWAINPSLYPIKFDPLTDYTPVMLVARGPLVIVVHPSLPVKSVKELIALAKANPGKITFGSSGQGAIVHLTTELFLEMAGIKMTHVPYKGGGPALVDLLAGQISLVFATPQTSLSHVKSGRLRALGVTTASRIGAEPHIPTIAEAGVAGYEVTNWHGLIGPKGLPRAVVERMNAEANKAIRSKEVEERMQGDGVSPAGGAPEALRAQIEKEIPVWKQVVTRAGIRIQ
ncbi:MAG: Bug family tripartite tricarboxylate transporter substrate binding protein [Burkholderiales bacterium]